MICLYGARSNCALSESDYSSSLAYYSNDPRTLRFCWINTGILQADLGCDYLVIVASLIPTNHSTYDLIMPDLVDEVAPRTRDVSLRISAWLSRFSNATSIIVYEAAPYFFFIISIATSL